MKRRRKIGRKIFNWFDKHPDVGVIGAMGIIDLTGEGRKMTNSYGPVIKKLNARYKYNALQHISGSRMIIRRSAYNKIGNFDQRNFHPAYSEDVDYSIRANLAGFAIANFDLKCIHHRSSTACHVLTRDERTNLSNRNMERVLRKFAGYLNGEIKSSSQLQCLRNIEFE